MIEGILFDLDGVLVSTDELHYLAWKQLADRLGIPFSREQGDRCRGVSRMDSLEIVPEQAGRPYSQAEKEAFAQEKNQAYRAMLSNLSPADVPGEVVPTLKQLRQRGYRLALASGSKNAGLILERTGLGAWLDAVADGTCIRRSKPDPEIFLTAARLLGLPPSRCAAMDDAVAGRLPFLCENGAVVFGPGSPGPILSKTEMAREAALELCRDILAQPRCEVLISGANTSYLCPKQGNIVTLVRDFVGNNVALLSAPEEMPEAIVKVSAYCRDAAADMVPLLAPRWSTRFRSAVAGAHWLDFTLADKGTGLRQLCAALQIPLRDVAAFGDNYNDVPMLELAGTAYLMEGAAAELKARFPRHCAQVVPELARLADALPPRI